MAGAANHLPRFSPRKPDIFEATQKIRPLGSPDRRKSERVNEAEERIKTQAHELARAELERVRAEDKADFDVRLAEAQQRWTEETADKLAAQLTTSLDLLTQSFVERLSRMLQPFLAKAVRERAFDELSQTVLALLHSGRHILLRVSGNSELIERLRSKLDAYPHTIEFAEGAPDIRVSIDDTVIETRIGAWVGRLEAALAGELHG